MVRAADHQTEFATAQLILEVQLQLLEVELLHVGWKFSKAREVPGSGICDRGGRGSGDRRRSSGERGGGGGDRGRGSGDRGRGSGGDRGRRGRGSGNRFRRGQGSNSASSSDRGRGGGDTGGQAHNLHAHA